MQGNKTIYAMYICASFSRMACLVLCKQIVCQTHPRNYEKFFVKYGDEAALKKRYFMHELNYGPETSAE